jgi:glycosyltransferase involved in cell wall biosynthesis
MDGNFAMNICLVGVTHLSNNPRLVREADALVEAGHDVRVVAPSFTEDMHWADLELAARGHWRLERFDWRRQGPGGLWRSLYIRGRRRLAFELHSAWKRSGRVGLLAYTAGLPELTRLAAAEPADWFIAHAHGALPIAARAAGRHHAALGFDCEDYLADSHAGDSPDLIRLIERSYLARCDYVSTPSNALARALIAVYGDLPVVALYNVPSAAASSDLVPPSERPTSPVLRLHWMSQTVGPHRGIEDAIRALGLLDGPAELYLRGAVGGDYKDALLSLARECGVADRIFFLDRVAPADVVTAMGSFDIGLALELSGTVNSCTTVSNKLFAYMSAGLAVAATDTIGHREVLSEVESAGFLFAQGDTSALARCLQSWLVDSAKLRVAQQAAWDASRNRYCWDVEKRKYLEIVQLHPRDSAYAQRTPGAV